MNHSSRLLSSTIALFPILLLSAAAQENRWVRTNGPEGGKVIGIAVVPGGSIIAVSDQTFVSHDGGGRWSAVTTFPRDRYEDPYTRGLSNVTIDSSGSLVGIYGSSAVRSSDNGATWVRIDSAVHGTNGSGSLAIGIDNTLYSIGSGGLNRLRPGRSKSVILGSSSLANRSQAVSIGSDGSIYVGTAGSMVYRSLDNGDSWNLLGSGAGDSTSVIRMIETFPDGRLIIGTSVGLFHSSDGGGSWSRDAGTAGFHPINALLRNGDEIHIGTTGAGLLVSRDAGATWSPIGAGLDVPDVWSLFRGRGETLYAGTSRGFNISADGGETFEESSRGMIATWINHIVVDRNRDLYATTETGIFRSTDQGDLWSRVDHSLVNRPMRTLVRDSVGGLIAYAGDATLLYSSDGGTDWRQLARVMKSRRLGSLVVGPRGDLFMASMRDGDFIGGILRSTDSGDTWNLVHDGIESVQLVISPTGTMFATAWGDGLYRSTDKGDSWYRVAEGPANGRKELNTMVVDGKGGVFAVDGSNWFWRSLDDGETWEYLWRSEHDFTGILAIGPEGELVSGVRRRDSYAYGLELSTDRGNTWRDAGWTSTAPYPYDYITALVADPDGSFYAGTRDGVMRSSRLRSYTPGPPMKSPGITMEQNTPNPFSTTSTIRLTLDRPADVRLSLLDILGNEVAVLYNGHVERGSHLVEIDRQGLPSGVYGCRLLAGGIL